MLGALHLFTELISGVGVNVSGTEWSGSERFRTKDRMSGMREGSTE